MLKIFLLSLIILPFQVFAAADNCAELPEKLKNCENYICTMQDMQNPEADITHNITGLNEYGKCHHSQQTFQGLVVCNYTEKTRKIIAKLAASKNKTEADKGDLEYAAKAFASECELVE